MTASFSDLQTFWECPRKLGFTKLGYRPVAYAEALTTGQFVHEGLRAYFIGGALDVHDATLAINEAKDKTLLNLDRLDNKEQKQKLVKQTSDAASRSHSLLSRYFDGYAGDYKDARPEVELHHANIVCHVDLLAEFKGLLAVVDFKTSKNPDMRWYDVSGQCDLYAYVLEEAHDDRIGLIVYDIISEEGLFRHVRMPNLVRGKTLLGQITTLDNYEVGFLLKEAQYHWRCPQCDYFTPCYIYETCEPRGAIEYLMSNYAKEAENVET